MRVASFGATCNSLDPGGVLTELNECVINDPELWQQIMDETLLKNILVDGGESLCTCRNPYCQDEVGDAVFFVLC